METPEEPISNDFDFEASNMKLEKDDVNQTEVAPAYKKGDFFDTLQDGKQLYSIVLALIVGRTRVVATATRISKRSERNPSRSTTASTATPIATVAEREGDEE